MHSSHDKKPSAVKIMVSRDKLTALLCPQGKHHYIDPDEIHQELQKSGVIFGINEEAVFRFSLDPGDPVVVARGVPPAPGRDGYLEVLFNQKDPARVLDVETDTVDFRETSDIISVDADDLLVRAYPPEDGTEGIAVTGEAIQPPKPKAVTLQAGKEVYLGGEGDRAYAKVSGRPWVREAGQLKIVHCEPVYVHQGDVDIKTGHLRFKGDVRIHGNVCEAMEVEVAGNLEVHGLLTMARVTSGGKMTVYGNVISSMLRAGILFPGAKKLAFMVADLHGELENLATAMDQLKRKRIIDFEMVDFGRVALGLLDSRFKNIRPMIKNVQTFLKNKTGELPFEIVEAVNSLSCFYGLKPLSERDFKTVLKEVTSAVDLLATGKGEDGPGIVVRSALSSVIQSSGNVTVTGQGCVNTNINAGKNVYIKGSFKGGEIFCEGNADINDLGSNLGAPPVVRVAAGSIIKLGRAYEGTVLQVGNRRVTLTRDMASFQTRLNKDEQLELY